MRWRGQSWAPFALWQTRRKAEFEKGTDAFDMNGGFNAVRDEGALKEILKSIFGKQ